ncbi:hypothetical protein KKF84_03140 [Myxococcota bacterium]|nr:hypothetical protein [Myxococcota bacterium]MBU1534285.1 hypothetical protein [Myxococcota bacterium]
MTPYEFYAQRHRLLINAEKNLNLDSTVRELHNFSKEFKSLAPSLDQAYQSMDVCVKTGEPQSGNSQ